MDAQVPAVVAVMVTTEPGPWFEEALSALAAQDYQELSILVLSNGAQSDEVTERVGRVLPDAFVRHSARPSGLRPDVERGPRDGGGGCLLPAVPRRRGARPRCGGSARRGGLPFQRRSRLAQVRQLGRPADPAPRRHELRQDRVPWSTASSRARWTTASTTRCATSSSPPAAASWSGPTCFAS